MKLIRLQIKNFKGIREFVFEPNGADASISGENATGKTTIADAFSWLLFGKDSLNKADFEIKPLDVQGDPEHGLEHEVSATLDIDGSELILKKVLTERWVKRRGSATQEFTGHSIDHYIDGVPVKEREYKDKITEIAPEETFRLLTNPRYFSEHLKWTDRRRIVLDVCGDITDSDVIEASSKLDELPDVLGKHKLDDYRKILAGKRTEINKVLADIPVRISEQQRNIVDAGVQAGPVREKIAELETTKKGLDLELSTLESGGAIAEKKRSLAEIETKLIELLNKEAHATNEALESKRKNLGELKWNIGVEEVKAKDLARQIASNEAEIILREEKLKSLRREWQTAFDSACTPNTLCFACGQEIPESKQEEQISAFNQQKADRLKQITESGKAIRTVMAEMEAENKKHAEVLAKIQEQIENQKGVIAALENEINNPSPPMPHPDYGEPLVQQKMTLESEITAIIENRQAAIEETKTTLRGLDLEIEVINNQLAQIDQDKKSLARIADLKKEERKLAGEYEQAEKESYLCDLFVKTKVSMLTDKINSRFQTVTWKLFNELINGGIEECCEAMIGGIPYWSANNAGRLNAGIDVSNVLAEHYGVSTVQWLDNAEAVNEILPSKNQQIKLLVTHDKELKIHTEDRNERQAA